LTWGSENLLTYWTV